MQTLSLLPFYPEPLPGFSEAARDLQPLLALLFESLDAGASVCRLYGEEHCGGGVPGPHLREMVVRDQAKRYLTQNGLRVREQRERGLSLAAEPLISLLMHYRGYAIRVLKGKGGIAPGCGRSKKRRAFYNQTPVRYWDGESEPSWSQTNLLVLWDFDERFGIAGLWLACPEMAGSRSHEVVLAWQQKLPHPAAQPAAVATPSLLDDAAKDAELEALLQGDASTVETGDELWSQLNFDLDDLPLRSETLAAKAESAGPR